MAKNIIVILEIYSFKIRNKDNPLKVYNSYF